MRRLQLTSKTRLAVRDSGEREEAILEEARQKGTILQVPDRLPLSVQHALYSFDDVLATSEEELEKLDMWLKRHLARTRSNRFVNHAVL
jgi:hypothetical protein